jgi:hypothetical protein
LLLGHLRRQGGEHISRRWHPAVVDATSSILKMLLMTAAIPQCHIVSLSKVCEVCASISERVMQAS